VQALEELGEPAGQVDVAAADVVERQHAAEQPLPLLRHRHAYQDAIPSGLPGVGSHAVEAVRSALGRVEAPAHAAVGRPLRDLRQVIVVKSEASPDRGASREVEHLRGGQSRPGEIEQPADDTKHGVRLAKRPVGEPHMQVNPCPVAREPLVRFGWFGGCAERGVDQRCEHLDVRAHDDDVARLQRRVAREQVQDRFADDLDLAGAAVAGMHLETAVVRLERHALVRCARERRPGGRAVAADVVLDSAEKRPLPLLDDRMLVHNEAILVACENELHFAGVPTPGGKQRVPRQRRSGILRPTDDRRTAVGRRRDPCPELGRWVEEEEVYVARGGERAQDIEIGGRQTCEPEQRDPRG
jgi:hypothetical protein